MFRQLYIAITALDYRGMRFVVVVELMLFELRYSPLKMFSQTRRLRLTKKMELMHNEESYLCLQVLASKISLILSCV